MDLAWADNTRRTWMSDSEVAKLVGPWWLDGLCCPFVIETDAQKIDAVLLANEDLANHESTIRVHEVRPSATEDKWYDWLVEKVNNG